MSKHSPIYRSDPAATPDTDFLPGDVAHLTAGRTGRLLDPRRTPVRILGIDDTRGYMQVQICAFEDAGAVWQVPLEQVDRYQFAPGQDLPAAETRKLGALAARLSEPMTVPADLTARPATVHRVASERLTSARWLDTHAGSLPDLHTLINERTYDPAMGQLLRRYLRKWGLDSLDRALATSYASNPGSGELVKGYAIVLADLGLCSFTGTVVRDPELFTGELSKQRRADHLLRRMGFVQALFGRLSADPVAVFRGTSTEGRLHGQRSATFVSASFNQSVAQAHFSGGSSRSTGSLFRRPLPLERLLMSFVEAPELNEPYREAEAVLVAAPDDPPF